MKTDLRQLFGKRAHAPGVIAVCMAVFCLVLSSVTPLVNLRVAAQDQDWSPPSTVYIPETGHTLDRAFLDMWRGGGGVSTFGNPITAEQKLPNGHTVQYMQYARFEYWPEGDENGNTVVIGKVGEELRPMTLQRSPIASTSGGSSSGSSATMIQMKAWLPVTAAAANPDKNETFIETTRHTIKGGFLDYWYSTGDVSYLGNPLSEEYTVNGTTYQVFEKGQISYNEQTGIQLVPIGEVLAKKYGLDTAPVAQGDAPTYDESLFVPPPTPTPEIVTPTIAPGVDNAAAATGELWVDINLSTEYMIVYKGTTSIFETYISSGRPGFDTPVGTFYVNTMLESQTMEGVIGGEYYNVPDVPYVMYFTGEGHAIHGTYWHNNFGTPMSHGCINMPMDAAAYLYSMAFVGMRVEIHY